MHNISRYTRRTQVYCRHSYYSLTLINEDCFSFVDPGQIGSRVYLILFRQLTSKDSLSIYPEYGRCFDGSSTFFVICQQSYMFLWSIVTPAVLEFVTRPTFLTSYIKHDQNRHLDTCLRNKLNVSTQASFITWLPCCYFMFSVSTSSVGIYTPR